MLISGIIGALWIAAAVVLHIVIQTGYSLALLIVSVAIPAVTAVLAVIPARRLNVELCLPETILKNEMRPLRIIVKNNSVVPILYARFRLTITNRLTGEKKEQMISFSIGSKRSDNLEISIKSAYCGRLAVSVTKLRVYDCFGILAIKNLNDLSGEVTVMPETFYPRLNLPIKTGIVQESDSYSTEKPGFDYAETFQLREYTEGDSRKQIHWKLTTKLDKPVVRDPGLPLERSVLIIWERAAYGTEETPAQSDAMAETLISLCRELNRQDVICKIVWNSADTGECNYYEIRDESDFYAVLPDLLAARTSLNDTTAVELYLRLYGKAATGKIIYLSAHISPLIDEISLSGSPIVLLCGETEVTYGGRIYAFDAGNFKEALFELDLY